MLRNKLPAVPTAEKIVAAVNQFAVHRHNPSGGLFGKVDCDIFVSFTPLIPAAANGMQSTPLATFNSQERDAKH